MIDRVLYGIMYNGLWLMLALLNAALAASKNDRRLKWFLLSLFLGPLASVMILARPVLDRAPGTGRASRSLTGAWSGRGHD